MRSHDLHESLLFLDLQFRSVDVTPSYCTLFPMQVILVLYGSSFFSRKSATHLAYVALLSLDLSFGRMIFIAFCGVLILPPTPSNNIPILFAADVSHLSWITGLPWFRSCRISNHLLVSSSYTELAR